jgi:hypothetical protein
MMGGNLVAVDPGLMKCAPISCFGFPAKLEKSCYLLSGSKPALSISLSSGFDPFLYLLVGDYKFSVIGSP